MLKVRSITTKVGDRGKTRLFSGEEVYKNSSRPSAYGDLDELVSVLGVARCSARRKDVRNALLGLQRELFVVASELATTARHRAALEKRVDAAMLAKMEQRRSTLERRIRMPAGFIIPGATPAGAHIDHARAVARRCERHVVALSRRRIVNNRHLLVWMNRLSDYLWLLARREEGRSIPLKGRA